MAKRFEPRVINKRIDTSISATINATRATTYIGVEAKTGPYTLQEITSTKKLVEKFSVKTKPSKSDGITMLHAGKFTQGFVGHVLRVNKDKIHVGIDSTGNTLLFNDKYELIRELTKLSIKPTVKDISNQPLLLVIDGVLYFNNQARTDDSNLVQTFYEYVSSSWTPVTGNRPAIISSWSGPKVEIGQTNTDNFLDDVHSKLKSDYRFIKYTNYQNRVILLSGYPTEPYEDKLLDYLVQYDVNFKAEKTLNYSNNLIKIFNNGISAQVENEEVTGMEFEEDYATNRLFCEFGTSNDQFVYNGTQYYSVGHAPSKVTGLSSQLIRDRVDQNFRDSILGIIASIYQNESKLPSTFIKQSVVIKAPAGKIFLNTDSSETMRSEVKGDLNGFVKLEVISYNEGVGTQNAWKTIYDYNGPEQASAASGNYLRITFTGNVEKVNSASINIVVGTLDQNSNSMSYNLYSMFIGSSDASDAITKDLSELTDLGVINAIVPNLIAAYGELGEEVLPDVSGLASDSSYQYDCYLSSNVESFTISSPFMISWTGYQCQGYDCISKDTTTANLLSTFYPQSANLESSANDGVNWIKLEKTVYYNYSTPNVSGTGLTYYKVSSNKLTASEFIEKLTPILYNEFILALSYEGDFVINGKYDEPEGTYHNEDLTVIWKNISQSSEALFAVVQKFTSAASLSQFSIEFDPDDNDIIKLQTVHNTESNSDEISFDPDKINGYGINLYYDKFNRLDRAFHVTELNKNGVVVEFLSEIFGNEISPKVATIQDYIDALDTLRSIEFNPMFVFDAGLSNAQYYKALATFAEEASCMIPAAPPSGSSLSEVRTWKEAIGYSTERFVADKWQRDVTFGDISFECSPTYYYLQLVLTNTNSVSREFEPIFGMTQGRVEVSDPVSENFSKPDREDLLDMNVNSIVRNESESFSYFNKNYTDQAYESDFSEEQNVRISNKIAHIANPYLLRNAVAKYQSLKLWSTTHDQIETAIQEQIFDNRTNNTARSFRVVCDDTNNSLDSRQLKVDVYVTYGSSVDEVLVYSRTENLQG